jgi:hypothetical protein
MFATLISEFQANARLRIGFWLIMAIVLSYPLLWLDDYRQKLAEDHAQAVQQLQRVQNISAQDAWNEKAKQAKALRVQLEDKLWQAGSKGLAQATIQSWLQQQFALVKIEQPRITVEAAQDMQTHEGIWRVSAKCEGQFEAKNFDALLAVFARHPQWVVVERLDILNNKRFTLYLNAYFQAQADKPA